MNMDSTYHHNSFNPMQSTQSTGLRKLDLNSGNNMVSNPAFQGTMMNGGQGQQTLSNDDLNQRTLSFGQTMGGNFNSTQSHHALSQSMDSSIMSTHGNYHSPKHNLQQQQPSLPSLLPKVQTQLTQSRAQPFQSSNPNPGFSNPTYYGGAPISSTSSVMSCKGSDYFQTPLRSQPPTTTAFTYQPTTTQKPGSASNFQMQKTLYESTIACRLKAHEREDFTQQLGIKVVLHAPTSSSQQQVLSIEITDDTNPFFLYSLDITESDYHILKTQLHLRIDFQAFHHMFANLLEQCTKSVHENLHHAKFYCLLELSHANEAHFYIIEPNEYRDAQQLHLKFKQANDDGIKKHLAGKLRDARDKIDDLSTKLTHTEEDLTNQKYTNDQIINDLHQSREENRRINGMHTQISDHLKIEEQKKINDVTEKMLLEASEKAARFDSEKRDLLSKFERDTKALQDKLDKLASDHQTMIETKRALEDQYKEFQQSQHIRNIEQTQKIESLTHELNIVTNQLNELRDANKNLDSTKYSQEKAITEYSLKYQNLDRELADKEQIIKNLSSHLETAKTQKSQMEELIESLKAKTTKMESKLEQSISEIKKAQAYVSKIEQKYKQSKSKLKLSAAASKQYEQALQQKQDVIDEQIKALNDMKKDFDRKDSESRDLKAATDLLQNQLNETKKTIESNQQTILYLNQRLTEKGGLGGYSTVSKPPTTASSGFKPSFTSLEQVQSSSLPHQRTQGSYERSPFRNIGSSANNINTPSSLSSASSINSSTMYTGGSVTLKNQAAPLAKAPSASTFTYNAPKASNENVSSNLPRPQFVSKYTAEIYNSQTGLNSNPLPLDTSKSMGSTLNRQNSQTSISSATSGVTSSVYSAAAYQPADYGNPNTQSFNPYQTKFNTQQSPDLNKMNLEQNNAGLDDYLTGNNDTKMSNNEAFMAFLSKNESQEDDE